MATNAAFLTAIRAMFVQGVTQHFREPPRQVTTAQLPAAFPLMPSGALGEKVLSCWNTNKTRSIQYIVAIEPVGQGTQSQNYDRLADMMDKLEVALRLLDENERRVVEALVAEGGSMLQKDISIDMGFSRVKTHRVVQSLVKRGLVTVVEHFNTNKVTLVNWLME